MRRLILAVVACLLPLDAAAQLMQVGGFSIIVPGAPFGLGGAAYAPAHDVYLSVKASEPGAPLLGAFTDAASRITAAPFVIANPSAFTEAITILYSPDVSDCAGGQGGFLVAWFEHGMTSVAETIRTQIVGMIAPALTPSVPATSSPPIPGSCATPDPFSSLGGGTCSGGGWYPPGMTPPGGTPAPTPPTLTPPATCIGPDPFVTITCVGPDPFAAIGGGVCITGGWLPLAMIGGGG